MMVEADSSISRHAVKVRKPYLITKQRERWTEEEHNKFLEALKQYGRAWRRIEEHIGSKSTVQIRSHAQKFFSKVVRESSSDSPGTAKSIEIPPPRPKRKPSHPYPRKDKHPSSKKGSSMDEQLWSFTPKHSASEQESTSPTSVLTPLESDTGATTVFESPKPCMPPVESGGRNATVEETWSGPKSSSTAPPTVSSTQDTSTMVLLDLDIQDPVTSEESPGTSLPLTSLKLFGRTFIVSGDLELQKPFSDCNDMDLETRKRQEQDGGGGEATTFNGGIPYFSYCLPYYYNLTSSMEPNMVSRPYWWALYGGMSLGFSSPSTSLVRSQLRPSTDDKVVNVDLTLNESCQTDSSSSSCNNAGNGDRSEGVIQMEESLPQPVVLKPSKDIVLSSSKPSSSNSCRGFMPYRRCVVKEELNSSPAARAERS